MESRVKNLSTQEILELLRTLEHRGVSREEVLKALLKDVEKHKEIGDFLVLRAQKKTPGLGENYRALSREVIAIREDGIPLVTNYNTRVRRWCGTDRDQRIKSWYDFGCKV